MSSLVSGGDDTRLAQELAAAAEAGRLPVLRQGLDPDGREPYSVAVLRVIRGLPVWMWVGHDPPEPRYKLLAFSKAMLTSASTMAVVHPGLECDAAYELDFELIHLIAQCFLHRVESEIAREISSDESDESVRFGILGRHHSWWSDDY
eukprot:SAG31_NODE_3741_length_3931_cov_27.802714_2_plen_148_part_00